MITMSSSNEQERVSELDSYAILDTPAETSFDELTSLAAYICGTPISLVSLVDKDRMWFKSKVGLAVSEIPRIDGFCSSAICDEVVLVVPDAAANPRLANHPLVTSDPKLRFYAGAPLTTPRSANGRTESSSRSVFDSCSPSFSMYHSFAAAKFRTSTAQLSAMLNGGFPHIYFPLGFNLFVCLCDRVFFVSRYSKPDGEHDGRESGQVLLDRSTSITGGINPSS